MTSGQCACAADDPVSAKAAIRKAGHLARLVDESHFGVSISRCVYCSQHYLTLFCERVDWAEGDDPQTWVAVPVSEAEAQRLRTTNIAADENAIVEIVSNDRRLLYHDMPKGAAETLVWKIGPLFVPGHD